VCVFLCSFECSVFVRVVVVAVAKWLVV
jgi:hypothetical protein